MSKQYIIVSPVRNEIDYLEKTILSVVSQKHKPKEYIIVNDGSTDGTQELISQYTRQFPWIRTISRPPKEHSPGAGVVEAFYCGYNDIRFSHWDFIVKLDGDLKFNSNYFEFLLDEFETNPNLGIASGVTFELKRNKLVMDRMPEDHVRGAAKMYRRQCWEQIGGLRRVLGWDTIDELKAQIAGWETKSYRDLVLVHYKPIGFKQKNIIKREIRAGERQHYLGYLFVFAIFRGGYRMFQKPYFLAGLLNIYGFLLAKILGKEMINDNELISHIRKKQKNRLTFKRKLIN